MNKLSICFIANFYKTVVFEAIAKKLIENKITIFWIVTKESEHKYLCSLYPQENILLIDRHQIRANGSAISDFKINELVWGDRVWKYEKENGIKYLTNIQQPIYDFIKNNTISHIFGETTSAHELLIHRICNNRKELVCKYYSDSVVRIPNGRFMFFKDEKKAEIVEKKYNVDIEKIDCPFVIEKPTYLAINDKIIAHKMSGKGLMSRLKRLITNENIEKNDPNVIHGYCRIIIPVREVINQITYKFLKTDDLASIKDKKYIFFGFHKQPEASIDVCGRYFENQFENVINLWRQLPPDWYLIVKEHSNAIGDRSFNFFRKLRKYPRIILMNEKEDSHELIRNAQLIATNTGTMALEAALMDVPSITLSQVFFNKLNYCRHCTWIDFEKYDSVIDLITEIKSTPNNIEEYREFIMKNSFEGIITDIVTYPDVMNPNNIEKIVNAFTAIIK